MSPNSYDMGNAGDYDGLNFIADHAMHVLTGGVSF